MSTCLVHTPLQQLREATAPAHLELEEIVAIEQRIAEPERYRELLEKFYGFYAPLEERLACAPEIWRAELDFEARRKASWLAADLDATGLASVPICQHLPEVQTWPGALGTMYVLEGATLGGRQISAMLDHAPVKLPRRFFSSYGDEVGARWRSFCEILNELSEPRALEEAATNARQTFDSLRVWLLQN